MKRREDDKEHSYPHKREKHEGSFPSSQNGSARPSPGRHGSGSTSRGASREGDGRHASKWDEMPDGVRPANAFADPSFSSVGGPSAMDVDDPAPPPVVVDPTLQDAARTFADDLILHLALPHTRDRPWTAGELNLRIPVPDFRVCSQALKTRLAEVEREHGAAATALDASGEAPPELVDRYKRLDGHKKDATALLNDELVHRLRPFLPPNDLREAARESNQVNLTLLRDDTPTLMSKFKRIRDLVQEGEAAVARARESEARELELTRTRATDLIQLFVRGAETNLLDAEWPTLAGREAVEAAVARMERAEQTLKMTAGKMGELQEASQADWGDMQPALAGTEEALVDRLYEYVTAQEPVLQRGAAARIERMRASLADVEAMRVEFDRVRKERKARVEAAMEAAKDVDTMEARWPATAISGRVAALETLVSDHLPVITDLGTAVADLEVAKVSLREKTRHLVESAVAEPEVPVDETMFHWVYNLYDQPIDDWTTDVGREHDQVQAEINAIIGTGANEVASQQTGTSGAAGGYTGMNGAANGDDDGASRQ
ncbi:hypothetical protein HK101_006082 [Irineochytrium annulatum]|nr:hypothetical protein HK101_006082 [Irineochytrium annulatum]